MKVSLVLTVLDEGEHIRRLLESILEQTRPPDEVVVCDGGSRDNTLDLLRQYGQRLPLRVVSVPGANISRGRNAAIRSARGDIIAVTDAGVWLEPHWLEYLLRPIESSLAGSGDVPVLAAGFFVADPETTFEVAMGATVLPELRDIDPARFLPSSRSVAFHRSAWEAVGGYPEWLDYSEDVVFDLELRERFGPFAFALDAIVHFRPRSSLRAFARQYFKYAEGDGRAGLFPKIHLIRYFTYLVAAPLVLYAALTVSPWLWLLGGIAGLTYVRTPVRRLRSQWDKLSQLGRVQALLLIPVIRVVGDVAKMAGYPPGVWRRLRATAGGGVGRQVR